LRAGMRSAQILKILAKTCAIRPTDRDCMGDLPTFVLGDDYRDHTQFVALAQAATSPNILNRTARRPGAWYRSTEECNGRTGASTGLDCDEYPYASTQEGGPQGYAEGRVALEPVVIPDNRGAGAKLGAFYDNPNCPIPKDSGSKSTFLVTPAVG